VGTLLRPISRSGRKQVREFPTCKLMVASSSHALDDPQVHWDTSLPLRILCKERKTSHVVLSNAFRSSFHSVCLTVPLLTLLDYHQAISRLTEDGERFGIFTYLPVLSGLFSVVQRVKLRRYSVCNSWQPGPIWCGWHDMPFDVVERTPS
jgi:hypothetical protein